MLEHFRKELRVSHKKNVKNLKTMHKKMYNKKNRYIYLNLRIIIKNIIYERNLSIKTAFLS